MTEFPVGSAEAHVQLSLSGLQLLWVIFDK